MSDVLRDESGNSHLAPTRRQDHAGKRACSIGSLACRVQVRNRDRTMRVRQPDENDIGCGLHSHQGIRKGAMMDNEDRVQSSENPYGVTTPTIVAVSAPLSRRPTVDEIAMAVVAGHFQGVLGGPKFMAKRAYEIADAMIAERERREKGK